MAPSIIAGTTMSRILALDTSTDACSVALSIAGEVHSEFVVAPRRHTHLLLPMVERLLAEADLKVASLDAIAFGRGPGSFAGIRIATGAAQGLALAADLPLLPVSTLASMAVQGQRIAPELPVIAALDARMDEVYWAAFDWVEGQPRALCEEQVAKPGAVQSPRQGQWLALGSGWKYRDQMAPELLAQLVQIDTECYPSAEAMLPLAQIDFEAGRGVAPEQALPTYLRDGSWKKRDEQ